MPACSDAVGERMRSCPAHPCGLGRQSNVAVRTEKGAAVPTVSRDGASTLPYGACCGTLGCRRAGPKRLDECEEDYGRRTANEVVELLKKFFTPLGDVLDERSFQAALLKIVGVAADGALLKTANVLRKGPMPNIVIIMRDPCHIVRPSVETPLKNAGEFQEQ